jgi:hypothetical protein
MSPAGACGLAARGFAATPMGSLSLSVEAWGAIGAGGTGWDAAGAVGGLHIVVPYEPGWVTGTCTAGGGITTGGAGGVSATGGGGAAGAGAGTGIAGGGGGAAAYAGTSGTGGSKAPARSGGTSHPDLDGFSAAGAGGAGAGGAGAGGAGCGGGCDRTRDGGGGAVERSLSLRARAERAARFLRLEPAGS